MRPRRTPSSTTVFRLVGGTEDNDLWTRIEEVDGIPVIVSVWELTPEERQHIAAGANLQLEIHGAEQPPVAMQTTFETLGKGSS